MKEIGSKSWMPWGPDSAKYLIDQPPHYYNGKCIVRTYIYICIYMSYIYFHWWHGLGDAYRNYDTFRKRFHEGKRWIKMPFQIADAIICHKCMLAWNGGHEVYMYILAYYSFIIISAALNYMFLSTTSLLHLYRKDQMQQDVSKRCTRSTATSITTTRRSTGGSQWLAPSESAVSKSFEDTIAYQ